MSEYIGKPVAIRTETGLVQGRLLQFDKENGKILLECPDNKSKELDLLDVLEVNIAEEEDKSQQNFYGRPLSESDMHKLFYEAFNVYGPFEDAFCMTVSLAIKKFLRDVTTARICIIIGSDDVFGLIGLCLARLLHNKALEIDVYLACELCDLRTLRYREAFLNSGGSFVDSPKASGYTMVVYACNRSFEIKNVPKGGITLLLDLPSKAPNVPFTGLGLGFAPEHYHICPKFYYIIDVGFGSVLASKYDVYAGTRGSLVKVEIAKQSN